MLRYLFFLILLIAASNAGAQNVTISGVAKGAEGKTILLKQYSDFFSMNEVPVAKNVIDSLGCFTIKGNINGTSMAVIHIEYYSGEIYLEPNKTYNVEIKNLVFNEKFDKVNYTLSPFTCFVRVLTEDKNELNSLVQKLNIMYNSFLRENVYLLNKKQILSKVDTFLIAVNDTFAGVQHPFFSDYLKYRLASLKHFTSYSSPDKLFLDYLYQKAPLYDNVEYLSFFSGFFEAYFNDISRPVLMSDLYIPVNSNKSYFELMDVLGKDSLLKNEKFRELVAVYLLNVCYANKDFSKNNVVAILENIAMKSKFEQHKHIAGSILQNLTRLNKGMPAPDFELKSTSGSYVKLSDFIGHYVYLNFFTSWCLDCKAEMELMKKLRENYGNEVVFISVSADREFMKAYHFAHDNKYNWLFLHLNSDYDLLESYSVYAYPAFALIDKNGKIIKCPAPKPSDNIEFVLNNLIKSGN
ncbi:MAG: TlpA family protein disulfide reductase [Bacteroidales bacterium]|nr:TlpA family protein disulfide reductase [Bacteroidales bacterium]